jgi:hypothetical protein
MGAEPAISLSVRDSDRRAWEAEREAMRQGRAPGSPIDPGDETRSLARTAP